MKRTDVNFPAAFAATAFLASTAAFAEGKATLSEKLLKAGLKAGQDALKGNGVSKDLETLVADPELVALAKEEDPQVADLIELLEKGAESPAAAAAQSEAAQPPVKEIVKHDPGYECLDWLYA